MQRVGLGLVACLVGCGPVVADGEADSTSTTGDETGTSIGPTTSPETTVGTTIGTTFSTSPGSDPTSATTSDATDDDDDSDDTSDPGCSFLGCGDFGSDTGHECDPWLQDCVDGEKCMPWANDGGPHWNSMRCSPHDMRADVGDPCIVEGSYVSGIDNCPLGAMCLFVDPATNEGICIANCQGSEASPVCADPSAVCQISFDGHMINCLPVCDPIVQDCVAGGCHPDGTGDTFACGPTIGDGVAVGGGCSVPWDCAPGSTCVDEAALPECQGESCCAAYCDLFEIDSCVEQGLTCIAWFEEGQAPPGLERVGVCAMF